jgi:hypothetical protein
MGKNLIGIKRVDLTPLNPDGSDKVSPETKSIIDLAKTATMEFEIKEGEKIEAEANGYLKAVLKRPDIVTAVNLTLTKLQVDPEIIYLISGKSKKIEDSETSEIIGFEALTTEEQQNNPQVPLKIEIYVTAYSDGENTQGEIIGYDKFTFPYCLGSFPDFDIQESEFVVPEFNIRAKENLAIDAGMVKNIFVETLPA